MSLLPITLLPHLVLNILISGNENDALAIRTEMITVLNDQVDKGQFLNIGQETSQRSGEKINLL